MKFRPLLIGISSVLGIAIVLGTVAPGTIALLENRFFSVPDQKKEGGAKQLIQLGAKESEKTNEEQRVADIYQRVNPAVVTVYTNQEMGSGMVIKPEGLVITNTHVIRNSIQVKVKTFTGQVYPGRVVDFDLRYDLALVKLNTQNTLLPTVALASKGNVNSGDRVYALGSPAGQAGTLTMGTFIRMTEHGSLQISPGLLSPGNSGGPLLNSEGEMIGVNKGILNDNSGLATSIVAVRELVERHERAMDFRP